VESAGDQTGLAIGVEADSQGSRVPARRLTFHDGKPFPPRRSPKGPPASAEPAAQHNGRGTVREKYLPEVKPKAAHDSRGDWAFASRSPPEHVSGDKEEIMSADSIGGEVGTMARLKENRGAVTRRWEAAYEMPSSSDDFIRQGSWPDNRLNTRKPGGVR